MYDADSTTSTTTHLEIEDIAAFIDGRLSSQERVRATEHLSLCEDCYTVFAETVRFQKESPRERSGGGILSFPFRRTNQGPPQWATAAVAAVVVAAIGIGGYSYLAGSLGPPEMKVTDLAGSLSDNAAASSHYWDLRVKRSLGAQTLSSRDWFQFGVTLLDLQISLESGDQKKSASLADQARRLLLARNAPEAEDFAAIATSIRSMPINEAAVDTVARVSAEAEIGISPAYSAFGKWAEAGRIAASLSDPDFFESRKNRRFLTWLRKQKESRLSPEVLAQLERIDKVWTRGALRPKDFSALEDAFYKILDRYNPH